MKRLLWLTALVFMIAVTQASAEVQINVSSSRTADESGNILHNIRVRITGEEPDANVMMVVNRENNAAEVNQGYADENGNLNFSFQCDSQGLYSGYINTENQRVKKPFTFEIASDYQGIIDSINGADADSIESIIDNNKDSLMLDSRYYEGELKTQILNNILKEKGKIDIFNVSEVFDKSVIEAYLYSDIAMAKKVEIIEYYDFIYFGLAEQAVPKNIYSSFLGFEEQLANNVFALIEAENPELNDFRNAFNEAAAMTAFNMLDDSKLDEFIINNIDYIAFDGYESLTPIKRKEVIGIIKQPPAEVSVSELIASYDNAIKVPEQTPDENNGENEGGGGSSGGRGSVSVTIIPSVIDKEEKNEQDSRQDSVPEQIISGSFEDIGSVAWAEDSITNLYKKGIINGKEKGKFYPHDNVTRAEFITMAVKAFLEISENAACIFSDVTEDDWCYSYVAAGYTNGIINGLDDNSFGKNTNITREDMAAILYRTLSFIKAVPMVEKVDNNIPDFDSISDYAKNSVLMLYQLKVINGMEDGSFVPKKNATRAEAAVMINNAMGVAGK